MWKAKDRKSRRRDSVLYAITLHHTTCSRLFGSHFDVPRKKAMLPSNDEWGHACSDGGFFRNNKTFHKKYSNA